ncbi:molybdenum cofactor guanylyltransferase [bacterium]|nr:MAG: molybdenum cofactor guanylyltransferase [bacterium]
MKAVNAIILAGGRNSRMRGIDKAFLEIDGQPFIARIIKALKGLVREIIVVTNDPEKYAKYKVKLVRDESEGMGPLMGICSGLKASGARYNFVVACDMPFINTALIKFMLDKKKGYDILLIRDSEKFHTLFGVYSKRCIPVMEEMIEKGELRVRSIFPGLKARFFSRKAAEKFDPGLLSVININTPDELESVKINTRPRP